MPGGLLESAGGEPQHNPYVAPPQNGTEQLPILTRLLQDCPLLVGSKLVGPSDYHRMCDTREVFLQITRDLPPQPIHVARDDMHHSPLRATLMRSTTSGDG